MCPQMKNTTAQKEKHVSIDQERNKDNLWFIKNYISSSKMNYKNSIINNMFMIIDLKLMEEEDKNSITKHEPLKNLIYKEKSKKKENDGLCKKRNIFTLDKVTNMVYHNDKYYGTYMIKYLEEDNKYYNSKNLIMGIHIYDKYNVYKYIFYPQLGKYKTVNSVFDEYESITKEETYKLAKVIDKQLDEIKYMLQDKKKNLKLMNVDEINEETKIEIKYDKYKIKKIISNVISKLCYSELDFSEDMYNYMNDYLNMLKNKDNEIENQ